MKESKPILDKQENTKINKRDIQDILNLCLNEIYGIDSWIYHKVSNKRIKEIYIKLVEEEHNKNRRIIEQFEALP